MSSRWTVACSLALILAAFSSSLRASDRSLVDDRLSAASALSALAPDTIPSPGMRIGITSYYQPRDSQGRRVATNPGSNTVHFAWRMMDHIPVDAEDEDRFVHYNSWNKMTGSLNQGLTGTSVLPRKPGHPSIDVNRDNLCHLASHYGYVVPIATLSIFNYFEGTAHNVVSYLPTPRDAQVWPEDVFTWFPELVVKHDVSVSPEASDIYHVIAIGFEDCGGGLPCPSDRIWYWRADESSGGWPWIGPVLIDSTDWNSGYVIDADDTSDRVAIVFISNYETDGLNEVDNVVYRESQTSGLGWADGSELGESYRNFITQYSDPSGPRAWPDISVGYDHQSVLHVVWTEQQSPGSEYTAIRHWNDNDAVINTVGEGYYANPNTWVWPHNLRYVSLGIGDGETVCESGATSNLDYLYVLYLKLGGETLEEQADTSKLGYANGELYLTVSPNGGRNWSEPANLTNTKTPDCTSQHPDSVCASEAWATIARDVSDIEIIYIRDYEAAEVDESGWTINDVMYLNIPGGTTDDVLLCSYFPCECPCHGDPACDGVVTVLDVVHAVNVAFRNDESVFDFSCPRAQTDVDCDGATNVIDVVRFVNVAFKNADPAVEFCNPCL